jgi:hypothetical protein
MKLKFLGVLLVLGLIGCAMFGAGSASATYLCKSNLNPCPEASRYPLGTEWKFKLVSGAKLTVKSPTIFEATCTGSEFGGLLESQSPVGPAKSIMTTHTITGCTELYPGCLGTTTITPTEAWEMQFTSKGSGGAGEEALWRHGRFILSAPCTNATSKCKYAAFNQKVYEEKGQAAAYEQGSVIWHITGGSQATKVTGFLGQIEGGAGCPGSLEIEGNFEIVKPVPLYLI